MCERLQSQDEWYESVREQLDGSVIYETRAATDGGESQKHYKMIQ